MYSLSQQEEVEDRADDDENHQCEHEVLLDTSGLDDAQAFASTERDVRRAVAEEAIDNRQVKIIADDGADALRDGTEAVQEAIDQALVHPLVDEGFGKPDWQV